LVWTLAQSHHNQVTVVDALTYASHYDSIRELVDRGVITFYHNDICDVDAMSYLINQGFDVVINTAAETHVDNALKDGAGTAFVHSNVLGLTSLLDAIVRVKPGCRPWFHHVSTDEVYGVVTDHAFVESDALHPRNLYAATKASAEAIVGAYAATYGLAETTSISRCCNNMGPRQHVEKLAMKVISNALAGRKIPVYGDGNQRREWIAVSDHTAAIIHVVNRRLSGTWNVGTGIISSNNETIAALCASVDAKLAKNTLIRHSFPQSPRSLSRQSTSFSLVEHVQDRLGHDVFYNIDASRLRATGWSPRQSFAKTVDATVSWAMNNLTSVNAIYG